MNPALRFFAALAVLLFTLPAQACINNDRTGVEERRFRSRYRGQGSSDPQAKRRRAKQESGVAQTDLLEGDIGSLRCPSGSLTMGSTGARWGGRWGALMSPYPPPCQG